MTLGQQLYVILLLIYVSDCIWWIPHTGWFLQGRKPGKFKARFAGSLGNLQGGFVFLHLIPGRAMSFELREWPFSVSRKGCSAWVPQVLRSGGRGDQSQGVLSFENPEAVVTPQGAWLHFAGGGRADARGADVAKMDAKFLQTLKELPEEAREACITRAWQDQVDPAAIQKRVEEIMHATRWLRFTGQLQWIAMFMVTPFWCLLWGLDHGILRSVGLIFGLAVLNTVLFVVGHRKLFPLAGGERWKCACIMLVSFPMSARGADLLTRKSLLGYQAPAVVTALASPDAENRRRMQHWVRDMKFPLRLDPEEGLAREIAEEYIDWRQQVWGRWWEDLSEPLWREVAVPVTEAARKICPRCLVDFKPEVKECPDCPGVFLQSEGTANHV